MKNKQAYAVGYSRQVELGVRVYRGKLHQNRRVRLTKRAFRRAEDAEEYGRRLVVRLRKMKWLQMKLELNKPHERRSQDIGRDIAAVNEAKEVARAGEGMWWHD